MRFFMAVAVGLILAACSNSDDGKKIVQPADKLRPQCYTVDLFDPYTIEAPSAELPEENQAFLGVWKHGAWNGTWCHDLYVTRVEPDGRVSVIDTYGPNGGGYEATAFKREGRIQDGELVLRYGLTTVRYRLMGPYLVGTRKDPFGTYEITLSKTEGAQTSVASGSPRPIDRPQSGT